MKVLTLEKEQFFEKCSELVSLIDFEPDLVIGIYEGGTHVMNAVKNSKNLSQAEFCTSKLQRSNRLKRQKSLVAPLLKILPRRLVNKMRVVEIARLKKSIDSFNLEELTNEKMDIDISLDQKNKAAAILIIDDAIDSGRTMFIVKSRVKSMFPKAKIKTAVLTWTIDNAIVKPDFYLYKNILVRFPWSLDYE